MSDHEELRQAMLDALESIRRYEADGVTLREIPQDYTYRPETWAVALAEFRAFHRPSDIVCPEAMA